MLEIKKQIHLFEIIGIVEVQEDYTECENLILQYFYIKTEVLQPSGSYLSLLSEVAVSVDLNEL